MIVVTIQCPVDFLQIGCRLCPILLCIGVLSCSFILQVLLLFNLVQVSLPLPLLPSVLRTILRRVKRVLRHLEGWTAGADRLFEVSLEVRLFFTIVEALDHHDFSPIIADKRLRWHLIVMLVVEVIVWLIVHDGILAVFGENADHA